MSCEVAARRLVVHGNSRPPQLKAASQLHLAQAEGQSDIGRIAEVAGHAKREIA